MASAKPSEFGMALRRLREQSRKSRYNLTQFTGVNESYLLRLESGERQNPTRNLVIKLGLALVANSSKISMHEVNELLLTAGHSPLRSRGESSPEVEEEESAGSTFPG